MTEFAMMGSKREHESPLIEECAASFPKKPRLSPEMNKNHRAVLFITIFVAAFAYSLDSSIRTTTLQPLATSDFKEHPLVGAINVVVAAVAAAAQPMIARIADMFGRLEIVFLSVIFYCVGTAVQATASNVPVFCIGAMLYNVGFIAVVLIAEVIIADVTSLRSRVVCSYIPTLPFLINTWLSGDMVVFTLKHMDNGVWRWSIGIWGIIYLVCVLPLMLVLYFCQSRTETGSGSNFASRTPLRRKGWRRSIISAFWQLDIIGMIFLTAALGLILTPISLAKGRRFHWQDQTILAPLVAGACCIPIFIFWEHYATYPMMPFRLLRDRSVWGSLGIALTFNTAYYVQVEYFYTVLRVGYLKSTQSATRIVNLYNFTSVITGAIVGLLVYRIRYLRPFIIVGTVLYFAAFALLIVFNGGASPKAQYGVWSAQILLGVGGGLFPFLTMASIQAAVPNEHLAVITGAYFATYRVGAAIGSAIAAGIWNHLVQPRLFQELDEWLAAFVFSSAVIFADGGFCDSSNPACPSEEQYFVIVEIYKHVQRWLCIVAAVICVPLILFTFVIRNPKLGELQSMETPEAPQIFEMQPSSGPAGATPRSNRTAQMSGTPKPPQTPRSVPANYFSGYHATCDPHTHH